MWGKNSVIYSLKAHMSKIHNSAKSNKCDQCSYKTYTSYNLKLHVASMHQGPKLVKESCPHCKKETTNMKLHMNTYHVLAERIHEI